MTPPQIRLVDRFINILLAFNKPAGVIMNAEESQLLSLEAKGIQAQLGMNGYQILAWRNAYVRKNEEAAAKRQAVFAHLLRFGIDDSCGSGAM